MQDQTIELRIGSVSLRHPLSPVPSNNTKGGESEWMCYFNTNDTKCVESRAIPFSNILSFFIRFASMLEETARLVAERYQGRNVVIVAPETAPIALVHVLRTKYNLKAHNIGKKKRPHMSSRTIREVRKRKMPCLR